MLWFWTSEVRCEFYSVNIKVSATSFPLETPGRIHFLAFSIFKGLPACLAGGAFLPRQSLAAQHLSDPSYIITNLTVKPS